MKYALTILTALTILACKLQDKTNEAFIMTWDTRNEGYGDSTQIVVPLRGTYSIEWIEVGNNKNKGVVKNCVDNTILNISKPGNTN